ncbi:MAG: tetratricopeptide repeat protein [Geobacter sp.]
MYYKGEGVKQDYKQAAKWYQKAADQGHASAQYNLGIVYENGYGITQNYSIAHMWYNIAGANGKAGAVEGRNRIAQRMTPQQISEAQKLAENWISSRVK